MTTASARLTIANAGSNNGAQSIAFDARRFRDGDVALLIAVALQLLEFVVPYPATVLKIIFVCILTFPGRSVFLPALLVCQFFASDFMLGEFTTYEYLLQRHEAARVSVLGFPLTTNYAFATCVTVRVLHEAISRPQTFAGIISPAWIVLWASCFLPAILSATLGKAEARFSWTAPIRDVMMVGCVFYGMILARNSAETVAVITRRLVLLCCAMISLAMVGYFYSRGMYFVAALGPALFFNWRGFAGRAGRWAVYAYLFVMTSLYAFAIYPTAYARNVAESLYSTSGNSVALIACWLLPIVIILILRRNKRADNLRRGWVTYLPVAAGLLALAIPVGFATLGISMNAELEKVKDPGELPFGERVTYKLFHDRVPIWRGALDEIMTPPYFLKTGGMSIGYRITRTGDQTPWMGGSHNLALEELRRNGWYSGIVCLIIILRANIFALRATIKASDAIVRAFAIASFCSLFILTLTSHIPMETNAALWLLGPAGMCASLVRGPQRLIRATKPVVSPYLVGAETRHAFAG